MHGMMKTSSNKNKNILGQAKSPQKLGQYKYAMRKLGMN
jgi:hypothetical protein